MQDRNQIYINGEWVASTGSEAIPVYHSATEEVLGHVPAGTAEDVDRAVKAARAAFDSWSQTPLETRIDYVQRLHEGLKARAEDIARSASAEVGMPFKLAQMIQAGLPIAISGSYPGIAKEFPFEEEVGNSLVVREPVGVVGCITPWNYPLHQIICKVAPALTAGCTVVIKPSEVAPFTAYILAEIMDKIGLPAGVFNMVTGFGPVVGEAIATHPQVDMVSFTGSTRAGKRVAALGADQVKRIALEMGGKSASVILEGADLKKAVSTSVGNCYLNSGQTCTAHTRMLVPESLYQEASELAVAAAQAFTPGDPFDEKTRLGPLSSDVQRERVRGYIRKGLEEGAELLTGGAEPPEGLDKGYFVRPTVFGRVDPDATIAQEEIFGPVLSIIPYKDEEDAVRIANDSIYGLAGGVWAGDDEQAMRVARRIRTGQIDINGGQFNPLAPFGGYKQSGLGREFGKFGLEEFLEVKSLQR
ncbi:MAG TPA: aldehyde dehydrogenase family protein [Gammaproteobacteria bacterium]|nr:aldehyde dehydrogenase family protein [Gammaproteobacteria bacterium]